MLDPPWMSLIPGGGKLTYDALFFFQAEDGIRDRTVTGVQTCALPISLLLRPAAPGPAGRRSSGEPGGPPPTGPATAAAAHVGGAVPSRSAERLLARPAQHLDRKSVV